MGRRSAIIGAAALAFLGVDLDDLTFWDDGDEFSVAVGGSGDRGDYSPVDWDLFVATDTGAIYQPADDRATWERVRTTGENPEFTSAVVDEGLQVPAFTDIANADPALGSVAISKGQTPHGVWWHNGDQWFAGDRLQFRAPTASLGGNSSDVEDVITMPDAMDIDIWQAHVGIVGGSSSDVYLDIYDADAGTVLFEHGHSAHGNEIVFGDPIDVLSVSSGTTIQFRRRNDSGGSVEFSGWLVWSFQEVL